LKRICLISDTHSFLEPKVLKYATDCDEIWHAGDIGTLELADKLAAIKPLRAVFGNIDGAEIRRCFPLNLIFELEGVKVVITHIAGYPGKFSTRVLDLIKENQPDLFICGHSHILKVMPDKNNKLLFMNPGACGNHGFHQVKTILRFTVENGKILNLEAIELGKRSEIAI
jgi:putative phosphoesterase